MYETASKRVYKSKRCVLFMTFRPSRRTLFMARRNWVLLALTWLIIPCLREYGDESAQLHNLIGVISHPFNYM